MKIDKLLFLHIPKTAGTSVHNVLHRHFSRKEQLEINVFATGKNLSGFSNEKLKELRLVRGHFAFGEHEAFGAVEFEYTSMLREPVDRCVSHYYYNLAEQDKKKKPGGRRINVPLKDLCETGDYLFVDNLQVRLLSGNARIPIGSVTREMMEEAWKNLSAHFPVIGIQEQFDAYILMLCDRYELRIPYYRKQRVNKGRKAVAELDEETRRAVVNKNLLDIELYERVKKKVMEEIEGKGESFQKRIRKFQKRNAFLSKVANWLPFMGKVTKVSHK
jgi:hypothetical protein